GIRDRLERGGLRPLSSGIAASTRCPTSSRVPPPRASLRRRADRLREGRGGDRHDGV
ncbi:MAG: hypothetical protein AVDCRST_MAG18-4966, partial [uncultured Thermomicrobiales bacterium]